MIGYIVSLLLAVGSLAVFVRAVTMIDRMSKCTCSPVAWAWIALAVSALWVLCATITGLHLAPAMSAFVVAVSAVLITDRRRGIRNRRRPA